MHTFKWSSSSSSLREKFLSMMSYITSGTRHASWFDAIEWEYDDRVYCSFPWENLMSPQEKQKSAIIALTWHWWGTIDHLKSLLNRNGEVYSFSKEISFNE
jgi:hypothetical protein